MEALVARLLAVLVLVLASSIGHAQPIRLATQFGDERSEIEVRDLRTDKGRAAIQAAFAEMAEVLALAEARDGDLARLAHAAANETVAVDPRFAALALRAQQFCLWSNGAFGPLAGQIVAQRKALRERSEGTDMSSFVRALNSAACNNMRVRSAEASDPGAAAQQAPAGSGIAVAEGSLMDLRGWLRGFAIDRAMDALRAHGAGNAWVDLGPVRRAVGEGPGGDGWPVILSFPGVATPVTSIFLLDRAMAVITPLAAEGARDPLLFDQRNGRETHGIVAVAAVTELAIDAESLAATVAVIGFSEGKMRLASLKPLPSALVLLGDGSGPPVRSDFHWLELPQIRRPRN